MPALRYHTDTLTGFPSRFLGNLRDVRIVHPRPAGGFLRGHDARHPLLVLNDGQDLEALGVVATLEHLARENEIVAPLVVAIPSNGARKMEYGVSGRADYAGRGARAGEYVRFVLEEVLPVVHERHRVARDPAHSAVLGASLGGLSAFDLKWRHPQVFGICGVFSGSFWWREDSADVSAQQISRIAHRIVREAGPTGVDDRAGRFWFQAGTDDETEDRDGNGVIDAIQDTTELIDELAAKGWEPGRNVVYHEVAGGRHETGTWAGVFGEFARFAFGRERLAASVE